MLAKKKPARGQPGGAVRDAAGKAFVHCKYTPLRHGRQIVACLYPDGTLMRYWELVRSGEYQQLSLLGATR